MQNKIHVKNQLIESNVMQYSYFVEGYMLGFVVATTIGVSGVLCLQNMMTGRISIGVTSALAAAFADMICAMLVVFGLQAGQDVLLAYKSVFSVMAGIFLSVLGLRRLFSSLLLHPVHGQSQSVAHAFLAIFFLALVDPITILDFMALCMGLSLDFSVVHNALGFVFGLFLGSATWWLSLCCLLFCFRKSLSVNGLQLVQQVVGAGIFGFGIWTIFKAWN